MMKITSIQLQHEFCIVLHVDACIMLDNPYMCPTHTQTKTSKIDTNKQANRSRHLHTYSQT